MTIGKKIFAALTGLIFLSCGSTEIVETQPSIVVQTPAVECIVEASDSTVAPVSQSRRMRRTAERSRQAAVRVYTPDQSVRGTGTYFRMGDNLVVVKAAHVVRNMPFMVVVAENGEESMAITAYVQDEGPQDLAVLLLAAPLESRTALEYEARDDHDSLIGQSLVYTGFPGHHDLLTIFGTASGIEEGHIIMQSYAWPGASGSAVLDERGRVVGILRAIDVNRGFVGPQLTEDIVWLDPVDDLDISKVTKFLDVYQILIEEAG